MATRAALAALALAAGLVAVAGPASAGIPLMPVDPGANATQQPTATGQPILGLSSLSGTGSKNPLLPPGTWIGAGPGSSNCDLGLGGICYDPNSPH